MLPTWHRLGAKLNAYTNVPIRKKTKFGIRGGRSKGSSVRIRPTHFVRTMAVYAGQAFCNQRDGMMPLADMSLECAYDTLNRRGAALLFVFLNLNASE